MSNYKKPLLVSALIAVLCATIIVSLVHATEVEVISVNALSSKALTFNLNEGVKFTGSLSISGGSGNDIDFYVTNPHGNRIVNLGRVSQGTSFEFTTQDSGAYTLHFDNGFSWFSLKTVTLSYDLESQIIPNFTNPESALIWIVLGAVIIGLVLVGISVYVLFRRNKNKPNTP